MYKNIQFLKPFQLPPVYQHIFSPYNTTIKYLVDYENKGIDHTQQGIYCNMKRKFLPKYGYIFYYLHNHQMLCLGLRGLTSFMLPCFKVEIKMYKFITRYVYETPDLFASATQLVVQGSHSI